MFLPAAISATAYLALKLCLTWWAGKLVRAKWGGDQLSGFIAGWLLIVALQSGIVLLLSAFALLSRWPVLACMLLSAAWMHWRGRRLQLRGPGRLTWNCYPPLLSVVFVFIAVWLRSLFFYDYTWDAQVYEIPRLVIWLQAASVFIHMPTLQLNLFVNEWNAELNALAYALASGAYVGFAFGNLEVLLLLFCAVVWVGVLLGATTFWAICLAAIIASAPAVLGLASTVKGDLMACTAFVMAFGWLVRITRGDRSALPLGMAILCSALAVGSKASVLIPMIAVLGIAVVLAGKTAIPLFWQSSRLTKIGFAAALLIFTSRFWVNLFVYGDALKRIAVEQAQFSVGHIVGNLSVTADRTLAVWQEMKGQGQMWALAGSMGASVWLILVVVLVCLFSRGGLRRVDAASPAATAESGVGQRTDGLRPMGYKWTCTIAFAVVAATLLSMAFLQAMPWSFRYFLPGVLVMLLCASAWALRTDGALGTLLSVTVVFVIAINVLITARPGEVLPTPHLQALAAEVTRADTPLKRISLVLKGPYQLAAVDALDLDTPRPLNILAFNEIDRSLVPLLGSHAQNRIRLVADTSALVELCTQATWDAVVVVKKADVKDRALAATLEQKGYLVVVDNAQYMIALRHVQFFPLTTSANIHWTVWGSPPGTTLHKLSGMPEVVSPQPSDVGFVSEELPLHGPIYVRARFEGKIAGSGPHAAHLSLHGQQPIITLPTGSYDPAQVFVGVVFNEGTTLQRLSFGLGGWTEGSGRLRLNELQVFTLQPMAKDVPAPNLVAVPPASSLWLAFAAGIGFIAGCALFGRSILAYAGIATRSWMGIGFVAGYAVFGLMLLVSLRYLGNPTVGVVMAAVAMGALWMHARRAGPHDSGVGGPDAIIHTSRIMWREMLWGGAVYLVLASWVIAVALTYLPMGWLAGDLPYQLPDIFDLPKHLFAVTALAAAEQWPPPNPFFAGEDFAYNFLFYFPSAIVAALSGNQLAHFVTFPLSVIAVAIALPMTILDIVRSITPSRLIHLGSVLLATWVGGLTPLWLQTEPAIGFFLYTEKLITSQLWVDELFQSVVFVPQHVFAVLCGVAAMFVLMHSRSVCVDYKCVFVAGVVTLAGGLASLILLPHLLVSFVLGVILIFLLPRPVLSDGRVNAGGRLLILILWSLPAVLLLPFFNDIAQWSDGIGPVSTLPVVSRQWFYVMSAFGVVVPLSIIGMLPLCKGISGSGDNLHAQRLLLGMALLGLVGLLGMLFGAYPDAGIKSGLWSRVAIVPLAAAGLMLLLKAYGRPPARAGVLTAIAASFAAIIILNSPTAKYFIVSAWRPMDEQIRNLVHYVRALPVDSRIALLSPEQVLVALNGRLMDFDFSPLRADLYMPEAGRPRAQRFWNGIKQDDPEVMAGAGRRYDYLIARADTPLAARLAQHFTATVQIAGYVVYKRKTIRAGRPDE